jgi:hypothetical protein
MPPTTVIANTIRPVTPFFLSWRISHTKKATIGSTKTAQNINDGMFIRAPYPPKGEMF